MNPAIATLKLKREEARKCIKGMLRDNSGDLKSFINFATKFTATSKAIRILQQEEEL